MLAPHALPEPDERIHDERRAGHADQREPEVHVEHDRGVADEARPSRSRSPTVSDTACCTWLTSLVIRDISAPVVCRAKKPADWSRMWPEQLVAEVADDALADVRHQVAREVGAEALDQVDHHDRQTPGAQVHAHAPE